jgi:hypothetical protein
MSALFLKGTADFLIFQISRIGSGAVRATIGLSLSTLRYSVATSERKIVIVAYKPKPGKAAELLQLSREHVPLLREERLSTDRTAIVCQAADETVVEIFEWEAGGPEQAHTNPRVLALWERYAAACDYVPLSVLPEAGQTFASFVPV